MTQLIVDKNRLIILEAEMINKNRKPDTETKGKAKGKTKPETTQSAPVQEEPVPEEKVTQPIKDVTPAPEATGTPTPTPETKVEPPVTAVPPAKPKPLTLVSLKLDVDAMNKCIQQMNLQLKDFEAFVALKRRPPANSSRIQIRDKVTGKIYKSKNNTYQSMLRNGELQEMVEKKLLGDTPEKNNFGAFALFRFYPDRFEEVHEQEPESTK
jgi:hypothetical protein